MASRINSRVSGLATTCTSLLYARFHGFSFLCSERPILMLAPLPAICRSSTRRAMKGTEKACAEPEVTAHTMSVRRKVYEL